MAATMEELEQRVVALEQQVSRLQSRGSPPPPTDETRDEFRRRILRELSVDQVALGAAWERMFQKLGITAEPIGAEKLQEMLIAGGHDPNDNSFSRGIIEMREE